MLALLCSVLAQPLEQNSRKDQDCLTAKGTTENASYESFFESFSPFFKKQPAARLTNPPKQEKNGHEIGKMFSNEKKTHGKKASLIQPSPSYEVAFWARVYHDPAVSYGWLPNQVPVYSHHFQTDLDNFEGYRVVLLPLHRP